MDEKSIIIALALIVIVYLVWTRKKEGYATPVENFTPATPSTSSTSSTAATSRSPSSDGWDAFNDYQGDYFSAEFDNIDGSVFTEVVRDAIDPDLQARQKNFVRELGHGDYNLANPSIVNTAKYQDRESVAINHIGLNAPRRPHINTNQKQIQEINMESGFADEDAVLPATILNPRQMYL
jgi:hypothetical protein